MTEERWEQFKDLAKKQFSDVIITTEELPDDQPGESEILEFTSPLGAFRLVRETRPLVLEKKEHYAKRATDVAEIEFVYSDTEVTHKLKIYKDDGLGEWEEISGDSLGL